jgi:ABC-2 type transport system ATP-binding protein
LPELSEAWGVAGVSVILGDRLVLDDVSLPVWPGAVSAVVGGDGAGKTTLLRALCGRVTPASGSVRNPGRRNIGYQPAASGTWANLTVAENLAMVAGAYKLPGTLFARRRHELLDAAGLVEAQKQLAGELSGGMRQKLGFCMAILHMPRLLILDEPSTGVDPVSRVELWALIADAAAKGAAVALATTYLDEAERAHGVLVLDAGVPLLSGAPAEVLSNAPGTITQLRRATEPALAWRRGRMIHQWHPGVPRPDETAIAVDMEDAVVAAALANRGGREPVVAVPAPEANSGGGMLVNAVGMSKMFGAKTVVDQVTIQVAPGEIVGLIGANGAGKTTVIRMLLGILEATQGQVLLFGAPPSRQARHGVGYVPQGLGLYKDMTVEENLAFVSAAYKRPARPTGELERISGEVVSGIGLGRQRQLAFTCALAHAPTLLVLDEPTSGVDPIARARLWDTIHTQAERGAGLLVSTHYMQEAEQCDRLILLDLGRLVAEGTTSEIIGDTTVVRVHTDRWPAAFEALRSAEVPVALAGREVRAVETPVGRVREVLAAAGVVGRVEVVTATLEEKMTAIVRGRTVTQDH